MNNKIRQILICVWLTYHIPFIACLLVCVCVCVCVCVWQGPSNVIHCCFIHSVIKVTAIHMYRASVQLIAYMDLFLGIMFISTLYCVCVCVHDYVCVCVCVCV